jgi:hypothetical protein
LETRTNNYLANIRIHIFMGRGGGGGDRGHVRNLRLVISDMSALTGFKLSLGDSAHILCTLNVLWEAKYISHLICILKSEGSLIVFI